MDFVGDDDIELAARGGDVRVVLSRYGAGLRELRVDGREAVCRDTDRARVSWYSGVMLAPWPNRLRDATWEFEGERLTGTVNEGLGHGHHGLVFRRPFSVEEQTSERVRFELELGADPVYPFAVRIAVEYTAVATGLRCEISATNHDTRRVPFAVGMHPYFPVDAGTRLVLDAEAVLLTDERQLPTGELADPLSLGVAAGVAADLESLRLDHCFTSLRRDARGVAAAQLLDVDGGVTELWQDESLPYTQVFTLGEFPAASGLRRAVGIEPQSAPANAFNSGEGLVWLAPGETKSFTWGIDSRSA